MVLADELSAPPGSCVWLPEPLGALLSSLSFTWWAVMSLALRLQCVGPEELLVALLMSAVPPQPPALPPLAALSSQ